MVDNPYKRQVRRPFDPDRESDDLRDWQDSAFQARGLGEVADVWEETITSEKMLNFLGYAASLSSAGYWAGIRWLLEHRMVDVLVATGANLTEDVYEAMKLDYWKVDPWFPDDEDLLKHKMDRFYDHAADEIDYRRMEMLIIEFLKELNASLSERTVMPTWKLLNEFGKWQLKKGIRSLTAVAAEKNIPVFCPALVDSGFGEAYVWAFAGDVKKEDRKLVIEQFWDAEDIFSIAEWGLDLGREKTAGYIGGGVPKDFTQLVAVSQALVRPTKPGEERRLEGGADDVTYPYKYSFQITTDSPQWGSLSGCGVMTEPISWGKQAGGGRNAQVFVDATIALRLIINNFKRKKLERKDPPDLSWFFAR